MPDRKHWLPLAGLAGLALWLAYEFWPNRRGEDSQRAPAGGKNILLGTEPRVDSLAPLERLDWKDVLGTADALHRDPVARDRTIAETAGSTHPPLRYLRGLLLLARGKTEEAAAALTAIPVAAIPVEHLYVPYRMWDRPGRRDPNPYRPPLLAAVAAGKTPAIVTARVSGREGDFPGALRAYLASDPGQWSNQDLDIFRQLRWQAGLAAETVGMLKAALKGGQVNPAVRPPLLKLISEEGDRVTAEQLQQRVAEVMRSDSPERTAVVAAVKRQLQLREQFLKRDFAGILAAHRERPDQELPDETLLLLVLSAAQQGSTGEFARWSRELRRRFPDPSVAAWLLTLQPSAPR